MHNRMSGARAAATRPLSALISAALLLLTMVAGVGGVGGFAALGKPSAVPLPSVAAASTIAVPVAGDRRSGIALLVAGDRRATDRRTGDRRAATTFGSPTGQHAAGSAPQLPELADLPAIAWQQPAGLADLAVEAAPDVVALTIQVSHRGRAPPAGSLLQANQAV